MTVPGKIKTVSMKANSTTTSISAPMVSYFSVVQMFCCLYDIKHFQGSVCGVARWEVTRNGKTVNYIERDCSNMKAKAGKSNCNDIKLDFTDTKHEACWAVCEGRLCNGSREVFGSMLLMALMVILL